MARRTKTSRPQVGLRVSEDMRVRLEKAAKKSGCSINSEIVERLDRSFQIENQYGGPRLSELIETIAVVMRSTGEHAGYYETSELTKRGKWMDLPFPFDQAVHAANAILERYRPPGKIVVPERTVAEVMGQHETKVDPEEAARMSRTFARLGKRFAAYEAYRREQDDE